MDTTTAAAQAKVTVATVRHWAHLGAVKAVKTAGRWDIDPSSLARRIRQDARGIHVRVYQRKQRRNDFSGRGRWTWDIGARREVGTAHTREDAELRAARDAKDRATTAKKEASTVTEKKTETPDDQTPSKGWSKARRRREAGTRFVHREMELLTGVSAQDDDGACHYCGLQARTCDCH